jgi:hypothetical protein
MSRGRESCRGSWLELQADSRYVSVIPEANPPRIEASRDPGRFRKPAERLWVRIRPDPHPCGFDSRIALTRTGAWA